MNVLDELIIPTHEQVIAFGESALGLRGFLAIHSIRLGPAFGGTRIRPYGSEDEALADALRLSTAMTYKCALAELPAGGGKAVLIERLGLRREQAFAAYGAFVDSLDGRFFTGGDIGIVPGDLAAVARHTRHVADENSATLGDINEHTAIGVWHGMRACLQFAGLDRKRVRVAIQGVGNVGSWLARILAREGMDLLIADPDDERAQGLARETDARVVSTSSILSADCDVLAPCALGGVLNAESILRLHARIVCGAANNQLASPMDGHRLSRRGILYAPDYLVNAGGVLRGVEHYLLGRSDSRASLERIYERMLTVAQHATDRKVPTEEIANEMAEARLAAPASKTR